MAMCLLCALKRFLRGIRIRRYLALPFTVYVRPVCARPTLCTRPRADTYLSAWASRRDEDIPLDADILLPLVSTVPDDDEYVQEYAPPANGSQLGKRGRSQDLGY